MNELSKRKLQQLSYKLKSLRYFSPDFKVVCSFFCFKFFFYQELSDLHVETLAVLGNCLEDVHTLQQIQLTGGIKKLLSFLEVSTVPDIQKNAAKAIANAAYDCM